MKRPVQRSLTLQQAVELRPLVAPIRAADRVVDELAGNLMASTLGPSPQLGELVLRRLLIGRHASVDRDSLFSCVRFCLSLDNDRS